MANLMTSMHKQLLGYDNDFDAFSSNDFTISLEAFLVLDELTGVLWCFVFLTYYY